MNDQSNITPPYKAEFRASAAADKPLEFRKIEHTCTRSDRPQTETISSVRVHQHEYRYHQ